MTPNTKPPQQDDKLSSLTAAGFAVLKTIHDNEAALGISQTARTPICRFNLLSLLTHPKTFLENAGLYSKPYDSPSGTINRPPRLKSLDIIEALENLEKIEKQYPPSPAATTASAPAASAPDQSMDADDAIEWAETDDAGPDKEKFRPRTDWTEEKIFWKAPSFLCETAALLTAQCKMLLNAIAQQESKTGIPPEKQIPTDSTTVMRILCAHGHYHWSDTLPFRALMIQHGILKPQTPPLNQPQPSLTLTTDIEAACNSLTALHQLIPTKYQPKFNKAVLDQLKLACRPCNDDWQQFARLRPPLRNQARATAIQQTGLFTAHIIMRTIREARADFISLLTRHGNFPEPDGEAAQTFWVERFQSLGTPLHSNGEYTFHIPSTTLPAHADQLTLTIKKKTKGSKNHYASGTYRDRQARINFSPSFFSEYVLGLTTSYDSQRVNHESLLLKTVFHETTHSLGLALPVFGDTTHFDIQELQPQPTHTDAYRMSPWEILAFAVGYAAWTAHQNTMRNNTISPISNASGLLPFIYNPDLTAFHYLILYGTCKDAAKRRVNRKFTWVFNHYLQAFSKNWAETFEKARTAAEAL
jgi:hypothetical protein